MPVFEFTGLTEAGKSIRGVREAESNKALRAVLRKDGVFVTEAHAADKLATAGTVESRSGLARQVDVASWFGSGVSTQDLAIATRQLATLIGAGITLVEALTALADQVEQPRLKKILGLVKQRVNEGSSLADALSDHTAVFNTLYINMIRAGETSGALDVVLVRLADFTESQAQLRNKIVGAMLYPIIMIGVGVVIVGILFVVVIPKVTKIFEDMNATLPWTTQLLIGVSSFVIDRWYVVLVGAPAVFFGLRAWLRSPKGRAWWHRAQLRAPVFGPLVRMLAISRFAQTLATLLASGVPLLTAMDIVRNIIHNSVLSGVIEKARDAIREGESIAAPLRRSGEFPPLVFHMIAIGEKSGQLEEMLQNVAKSYDSQVDMRVTALTGLLEPVMIVGMGVLVAFIVFAILMPIMNLNTFAG